MIHKSSKSIKTCISSLRLLHNTSTHLQCISIGFNRFHTKSILNNTNDSFQMNRIHYNQQRNFANWSMSAVTDWMRSKLKVSILFSNVNIKLFLILLFIIIEIEG